MRPDTMIVDVVSHEASREATPPYHCKNEQWTQYHSGEEVLYQEHRVRSDMKERYKLEERGGSASPTMYYMYRFTRWRPRNWVLAIPAYCPRTYTVDLSSTVKLLEGSNNNADGVYNSEKVVKEIFISFGVFTTEHRETGKMFGKLQEAPRLPKWLNSCAV